VQRSSADLVVRTSAFDRARGTFTVPARSAAVFWTNADDDHGQHGGHGHDRDDDGRDRHDDD
jgi:hypothetical protein